MNNFIDKFLPFERDIFLALNGSDSVFWDNAMWTFTSIVAWVPILLLILYFAFKNKMLKEAILVLGSIVLVIFLSVFFSASFFKPLFQRFRPTHHPDFMDIVNIVNNFRGEQFGFISGHATNSFGIAMFVSLLFKNKYVTSSIFFWALFNSYSRIYLGVHFISDIVAGFFFGSILGLLVYELYVWIRVALFKTSPIEKRKSIYSIKDGNKLSIGIILIIALIIILSPVLTSLSHSIIPESWS